MHPHLIALLAEQRRQSCPCGAYTGRPARRLARSGAGQTAALAALALFLRGVRP
jgi:hypothetical protein